jgi:tetratricopeptide (TPR) repeat protein
MGICRWPNPLAAQDPLAAADALWAHRADGHQGGRAAAGPVDAALAAYERAVKAHPSDLEPYWKLLRAIHYKGDFVARDRAERQQVFGRAREVSEAGLDLLARRAGGRAKLDDLSAAETARLLKDVPGAIDFYVWAGVDWGLWGDAFGKMAAARQGVGERIRHYGEVSLAMDERYERAAPLRLLGRLHTLAPKIPFVTGWVDRGKAVAYLRRAVALAPEDPYNPLYLADALLQHQPEKKAEAVALLRKLAAQQPSPERVVEDSKALEEARALLSQQGG